jgi:hypothetical protein
MARKPEDLEKVTIRLRRGDADKLKQFYPKLGYNEAIRRIVGYHVKQLEERFNRQLSSHDSEVYDISVEP